MEVCSVSEMLLNYYPQAEQTRGVGGGGGGASHMEVTDRMSLLTPSERRISTNQQLSLFQRGAECRRVNQLSSQPRRDIIPSSLQSLYCYFLA